MDATSTMLYLWSMSPGSGNYNQKQAYPIPGFLGEVHGLVLHPDVPFMYVSSLCLLKVSCE